MRKINVRFLDVLGSRGGYNYIISGMMYSTSCWNYRLSQNRRYDKEREKKQREGDKVVQDKSCTILPKHTEKVWKAVPDDISCSKAHKLSFLTFLCEEEI